MAGFLFVPLLISKMARVLVGVVDDHADLGDLEAASRDISFCFQEAGLQRIFDELAGPDPSM
jgi:hypothetical protein